jgi:biotin carboxyl carrier protein
MRHHLLIGDETHDVWLSRDAGTERLLVDEEWHVLPPVPHDAVVVVQGDTAYIHHAGRAHVVRYENPVELLAEHSEGGADDVARAPMPGSVVAVNVAPGDKVANGDGLIVIESMKMETVIRAMRDGEVEAVHVSVGDSFDRDAMLVTLTAREN